MTVQQHAATSSHYIIADHAVEHANKGLAIIPVDRDKRPLGSWKQYQTTPPTPDKVREAMSDIRAAGFAVICGGASSGLEVLDFDVEGFYEAWSESVGELVMRLPVQRTGGGGYQAAYRCDKPLGNSKLAWSPSEEHTDGREVAIETRGEGGYAVLAPSLHPSGNRYEYITDATFADAPHLTEAEVEFIRFNARRLCKAPNGKREIQARAERQKQAKPIDRSNLNGQESVIDAWNKAVPIRTMLERCGYALDERSGEYTRPGPDASPGGVVVFDDGRSFHHSTNDIMHDGKHTADSFELFRVYECGGNTDEAVKAAARELRIEPTRNNDDLPVGSAWQLNGSTPATDAAPPPKPAIASIGSLIQQHPKLSNPVIDGVLREGEVGNIIAASKVGKSWLMYDLLLSIATGRQWLDSFQCTAGRVLLIDNELHPQTIANRLPKVAAALGVSMADVNQSIDVLPLRGQGVTLEKLASTIEKIEDSTYQAIVLDAWYRFIPRDSNENSNADIMHLYNLLDQYAASTGSAIVAVHHASKGQQGDKAVTDVGAGAGSQSRAADAHVVLRPHEEDAHVVLEAAVRSFAPVEPTVLRWEFPVWRRAEGMDADALKDRKTKLEQRREQNDTKGKTQIVNALHDGPLTPRAIRDKTGMGRDRADRLLAALESSDTITYDEVKLRGQPTREYSLVN